MRMGIVALVLLAIVAMLSMTETRVETVGRRDSRSPLGEGRGEGRLQATPTAAATARSAANTSVSTARIAARGDQALLGADRREGHQVARIPANLPATLELVTLPSTPGARATAPKAISRTEALASVIGSQEFQDTVSPLARLYFATFGRFPDYEGLN